MAETRADRHNNPTAMTTDVAKLGGLVEGTDYVQGDPFTWTDSALQPHTSYTARLLGDPVALTVRVIDRVGFLTQSRGERWAYDSQISEVIWSYLSKESRESLMRQMWRSLLYGEKVRVVAEMYRREGGTELLPKFQKQV